MAERFAYNGKENNPELGLEWYDFDARNYDASLGRWMNIDPLAEVFYEWSPYNFNYNNPMRYIDPTGLGPQDLIFKGSIKSLEKVQNNLNAGLGGEGIATVGSDGKVSIKEGVTRDDFETDEQKAFFDVISEAADPEKDDTVINVVDGDERIRLGNHTKETIDIGDINAFGEGEGANQNSILGHEVKEQFEKQVGNPNGTKDEHHTAGKQAEFNINGGYERLPDTENFRPEQGTVRTRRGTVQYTTPTGTGAFNFRKGNETISVPFLVIRGNFQKIKD